MFASLIRRKSAQSADVDGDAAFESTTVSLSTAVPRPAERRGDERVLGDAARRQADRCLGRASS